MNLFSLNQVSSPGCFTGKEAPSSHSTTTAKAFLELEDQMNAHYDCESTPIIKPSLSSGVVSEQSTFSLFIASVRMNVTLD